jgi:hypothetical protein
MYGCQVVLLGYDGARVGDVYFSNPSVDLACILITIKSELSHEHLQT